MATKKKIGKKAQEETREKKEKSLPAVLANKVFESIKAMLDAYEARLKPNQTNEERYKAYLDPQVETKILEIFQRMIEGT